MVRRLLLLVIALGLFAPAVAQAEPDAMTRSAARKLAEEGDRRFEQGDYAGAAERFEHAYKLIDAPTLGIRWARSLAQLGHLVEASERYRKTAATPVDESSPGAFAEAVEQAATELQALEARIPLLTIRREVGIGAVTLDGRPLSDGLLGIDLPVDPGDRVLMAEGAVAQTLHIREGDRIEVLLGAVPSNDPGPATPETPSESSAQRSIAYTAYGIGLAGLGFGIGFGLSALSQDRDLSERCGTAGDCDFDGAQSDIDGLETAGTISTVGFVIAGISGVLGTVLIITEPTQGAETTVGLYVGALGGGVRGAF